MLQVGDWPDGCCFQRIPSLWRIVEPQGQRLRGEDGAASLVSIRLGTTVSLRPDTNDDVLKDNHVTHFCPLKYPTPGN